MGEAASALTIVIGVAAIGAFVMSLRISVQPTLALLYAWHVGPAAGLSYARALRFYHGLVQGRLTGEAWSPAGELQERASHEAQGGVWFGHDRRERLGPLADAYRRVAARIEVSFWLGLRAGEVAARESRLARDVARPLGEDEDMYPYDAGAARAGAPDGMIEVFGGLHTTILVPPPAGRQKQIFDGVRARRATRPARSARAAVSRSGRRGSQHAGRCAVLGTATHEHVLNDRVRAIAAERTDPMDFNGRLFRVEAWRAESSATSNRARIHLFGRPTTFATFLATNGSRERAWEPKLHLDGSLFELSGVDAQTRLGPDRLGADHLGASHLGVHLSIVTSDRLAVLVERHRAAELYGGALEGAFEVGKELIGLPVDAEAAPEVIGWLGSAWEHADRRITPGAAMTALADVLPYGDVDERWRQIARGWGRPDQPSGPLLERLGVRHRL